MIGHTFFLIRNVHALSPEPAGAICNDVNFPHVANRARLQHFHQSHISRVFVILRAHLSRQVAFSGRASQRLRFFDGVRQRLFAVDMQIPHHRSHRGRSMMVIGSRHDHGIQILLIEQSAVIVVSLCTGMFFCCLAKTVFVDITQCDDRFRYSRPQDRILHVRRLQ